MRTTRLLSSTSILFPSTTYKGYISSVRHGYEDFGGRHELSSLHCPNVQMESCQGREVMPALGTRPANLQWPRNSWHCSRRKQGRNSRRHGKMQHLMTGTVLVQQYPRAARKAANYVSALAKVSYTLRTSALIRWENP